MRATVRSLLGTSAIALCSFWLLAGCGDEGPSGPVSVNPAEATGGGKADGVGVGSGLPDVRCDGAPQTGGTHHWRHFSSWAIANLGSPSHRGIDLVARASDASQTLQGEIKYGLTDKSLEGEDVEVFACVAGSWQNLGKTRTDDEGRFALKLTGDSRLSIGLRDLYVSVIGDRSGTRFVGLVAADDAALAVSDCDGTLTSSENAFPESLVTGATVDQQPNASDALTAIYQRGLPVVYLTARGRRFTQDTRDWLDQNGFPRGPLRLAPSLVTLPGSATIAYKTSSLQGLGLPVAIGIGNRGSDVTAYTNVGVPGGQIFIKLPEFQDEVQAAMDAGQAVGIEDYSELASLFQ